MAKRGTIDHPKNKRLARTLGVCHGVSFGLLVSLWDWVSEFRKDGAVSRVDLEDALDAGGWLSMFTLDQIVDALTNAERECIWLDELDDGRFFIHDWPDHCEDSVHRSLARATLCFANGLRPSLTRFKDDERKRLEDLYLKSPLRNESAPKVRPKCALMRAGPSLAKPSQALPEEEYKLVDNSKLEEIGRGVGEGKNQEPEPCESPPPASDEPQAPDDSRPTHLGESLSADALLTLSDSELKSVVRSKAYDPETRELAKRCLERRKSPPEESGFKSVGRLANA